MSLTKKSHSRIFITCMEYVLSSHIAEPCRPGSGSDLIDISKDRLDEILNKINLFRGDTPPDDNDLIVWVPDC